MKILPCPESCQLARVETYLPLCELACLTCGGILFWPIDRHRGLRRKDTRRTRGKCRELLGVVVMAHPLIRRLISLAKGGRLSRRDLSS